MSLDENSRWRLCAGRWLAGHRRGDDGFMAIELVFGVAVMVVIAMVVLTLPAWPERQSVARVAAREAARAAVRSESWSQAVSAGDYAAREVASNYGVDPAQLSVSLDGSVERDGSVTARVGIVMPAVGVPGAGGVGAWTWTTSHTERVDQYRTYS